MEKSSKRGKIPQQDWPSIIARYEAGETLSSIARTYDCSPPAISYIVSRSRARSAAAEALGPSAAASSEPLLVKGHPAEAPAEDAPPAAAGAEPTLLALLPSAPAPAAGQPSGDAQAAEPRPPSDQPSLGLDLGAAATPRVEGGGAERRAPGPGSVERPGEPRPGGGNGFGGAAPQNADPRRTLHLGGPHANGGQHAPEPQPPRPAAGHPSGGGERFAPRPPAAEQSFGQPPRQQQSSAHLPPPAAREPARMAAEPARPREGGAYIDQELRERVDGDIAAFLAAFDAALAGDTLESRAGLREATDRLLRAGARTRIELERLEARIPLAPRDRAAPIAAAWRQR